MQTQIQILSNKVWICNSGMLAVAHSVFLNELGGGVLKSLFGENI